MPEIFTAQDWADFAEIRAQFAAETEAVRIVTNNLFTSQSPRNFVGLNTRQDIVNGAYNVRVYGARIRRNGGLVYVY